MRKKMSIEMKKAVLAFGIIVAVILLVFVGIKSGKNFKVNHHPAIEQVTGSDGRTAAGSEEFYRIDISPALALELSDKTWIIAGVIVLVLLGLFIAAVATGKIEFEGPAPSRITWVALGIVFACFFAAYSSAFVSNTVQLTAKQYEQVKDNPAQIEQLFRDKEFVR